MRFALFFIAFFLFSTCAYSQLVRISVDEVMNSELFNELHPGNNPSSGYPDNHKTYRVYAELEDQLDEVIQISANWNCYSLAISTDNSFWNTVFGGAFGESINAGFIPIVPEVEFDSYVTIGRENNASPGSSIAFASSVPQGYWTDATNAWLGVPFGNDMLVNDASWFSLPGNENNRGVGPNNRVLLFQVTTASQLQYSLNILIINDGIANQANSLNYVSDPPDDLICLSAAPIINGRPYGTVTILGCMDEAYCNYNYLAVFDDGSCGNVEGCIYPEADNYDPSANCDDGSCVVYGCTDDAACNYLSIANIDDSSCVFPDGCTDSTAENYNENALCDDGSCIILGCTNPEACNYYYWLNANTDDGSCILPDGCTDSQATNFDVNALCDDGSCFFAGCTNLEACNYSFIADTDDGSCIFPDGCTAINAVNYDVNALCNDGSCIFAGCTDTVACNYSPIATIDDGSCILPDGCTNPNAVNYDINALCDDSSCIYGGCTDPLACNYSASANIDDGSCTTSGSYIYGVVYHDLNNNNLYETNQFSQESTFSNWAILIEPTNEVIYTDANGNYNFHASSGEVYTVTLLDNSDVFDPKPNTQGVSVSGAVTCGTQNLNLGILPTDDIYLHVSGPCCIFMMDIHCNNGMQPGLWVHNTGSLPLNGAVTLTYDPILQTQVLGGQARNPTSITSGQTQWLITNQFSGSQVLYQCQMLGPGVDYIGQVFPIYMNIYLIDNEGNEVINTTYMLEPTVVCAYDPNDKYAVPEGYAEPHYILEEDEIEYRIRFQNTGNFVAEDINIIDSLDVEHLDLSTFTPRYGSHSFMTCFRMDEGIVDFQFENIMLPDSSADLEGSNGYVVYSIKPKPGIEPNAVISNTAYIYFESNPPIVTNTTWHTIYDCNDLELLEGMELASICANEELNVEITYPYADSFVWNIDGSNQGPGSSIFQSEMGDPGSHTLGLTASNPLCSRFTEVDVDVLELPIASFTEDGALLSAADATAWQWYLNGQLIEGATNQTYLAENNGFYSVSLTNEADCSDLSDESFITVVGIEEFESNGVLIYPNPTSDVINVSFSTDNPDREIELVDVNGRSVIGRTFAVGKITMLDCSTLSTGNYFLKILENGVLQNSSSVLVK